LKVLITGHTGFKGSWLSTILSLTGHELFGISLPPISGGIFESAKLNKLYTESYFQDICVAEDVHNIVKRVKPQMVFHLAAQPLVIESYKNPSRTIHSNVIGTMNLLEAIRKVSGVSKVLMVTTDKVYRNTGKIAGYEETEMLGGDDPYSVSKSMTDLMIQSWTKSFEMPMTSIVRGGNVVGGGDRSENRLMPDLIQALIKKRSIKVRNPNSVRPWQHVLDCLNGYMTAMDYLDSFDIDDNTWNFGPDENQTMSVKQVCELAISGWPDGSDISISYENSELNRQKESEVLTLNSQKARKVLGWKNRLDYEQAIDLTLEWEFRVKNGENALGVTQNQITNFIQI
jgi:CDP-glucose 4,6-dehydratase